MPVGNLFGCVSLPLTTPPSARISLCFDLVPESLLETLWLESSSPSLPPPLRIRHDNPNIPCHDLVSNVTSENAEDAGAGRSINFWRASSGSLKRGCGSINPRYVQVPLPALLYLRVCASSDPRDLQSSPVVHAIVTLPRKLSFTFIFLSPR